MADPEKQKEILRAAGQCFAHYGFSKTTMDDIGRMVGLNKASLYYYYKNKEAIFCEIIENEGENFISSLKEKISSVREWDKKIQTYLFERRRYFEQTANLHTLSAQAAEQIKFQPMFKTLAARFSDRESNLIGQILDQAIKTGEIGKVNTRKTANIILSLAVCLKQNPKSQIPGNESETKAEDEDTRFAVGLILDGLKTRK